MKTFEDRLDTTCRIPDVQRRRLIAAIAVDSGTRSRADTWDAAQSGQALKHGLEPVAGLGKPETKPFAETSAMPKWNRSHVRTLREKDFAARSNSRPPMVGWISLVTSFLRMFMPRGRKTIENSVAIVVEQPILDLLGITPDTGLDLTTDGTRLVITPRCSPEAGVRSTAQAEARSLKTPAGTLRKLAW